MLSSEAKTYFGTVIGEIVAMWESLAFREPVDWRSLGLLDYPSVVKRPMDLRTLRTLLEKDQFKTESEFFETLDLIWMNCQLYNHKNLRVHRYSTNCQKLGYALERAWYLQVKKTAIPYDRDSKIWRYVAKRDRQDAGATRPPKRQEEAPRPAVPKKRKLETSGETPRLSRRSQPGLLEDGSVREPTHAERAKLVWKLTMVRAEVLNQVVSECCGAILKSRVDESHLILDTELLDKELFWKVFAAANV